MKKGTLNKKAKAGKPSLVPKQLRLAVYCFINLIVACNCHTL